jgi:hypothetical protein
MKRGESFDESEGAGTGRNFPARRFRVKSHGAILGMQMQCNRAFQSFEPSFRDGPKDQTRNLEIPGSPLSRRPGMTGC